MYIGKLEPIAKLKSNERKYQKKHNSYSESKTNNISQKQINYAPNITNTLSAQTMFDVALLNSDS